MKSSGVQPKNPVLKASLLLLSSLGVCSAFEFQQAWQSWSAAWQPDNNQAFTGRSLQGWGFKLPTEKYTISPKRYLPADLGPPKHELGEAFDAASLSDKKAPEGRQLTRKRCGVTRGSWCGKYDRQERIASKPVPRGAKECPNACSGWGNCNYDTGICECPAGRGGEDCGQALKRPCGRFHRPMEPANATTPASSMGPDKEDANVKDPGWMASRCYGHCNDDFALCFCGQNSHFQHIPAPEGSPPWTKPKQWGRSITDGCMIGVDKDGTKISWGRPEITYDHIYGPDGWCQSYRPKVGCGCSMDGFDHPCDGSVWNEAFCVNQCSGHGECFVGYCRCYEGWYGADCSRKKAGLPMEEGTHVGTNRRRWLEHVVVTPPASLESPALPTRARPLIYVYDMPPEYTSRMLQYRNGPDTCMFRRFTGSQTNHSFMLSMTYSVEVYMHEAFLQSEHRTFDPEEADFFYVPMYVTCYFWPILGWADYPWWYAPFTMNRPMHGTNMILEAKRWLQEKHPWWDRRGGRDHIWLMAHDEGACWMPTEAYNTSIVLTHWGRMDLEHTSNSAYLQDNYTAQLPKELVPWRGSDFQQSFAGHPCYDPHKDLVIPAWKIPDHLHMSPLLNHPPLERDILFYFRGDVGAFRAEHYSRGIRQKLFQLAHEHKWPEKYSIYIGTGNLIEGDYSEHLARSKFCLVAPGDGWSPRAEDAVLHGCVPVVIMDGVHSVFESILDWDSFSVRIREASLEMVPHILRAVTPDKLARMQRRLAKVAHRFAYYTGPLVQREWARVYTEEQARLRREDPTIPLTSSPYAPFPQQEKFPSPQDDAFHTILQWLYHRIPDTR